MLTRPRSLKWKEKDQNTADFKIQLFWDRYRRPHYRLLTSRSLVHEPYDWLTIEPELRDSWLASPPEGRIVECRYDPSWSTDVDLDTAHPTTRRGGWRFVRFRDDKTTANDVTVLGRIIESLYDSPTKEELVAAEPLIRQKWQERHPPFPNK